MKKTIGIKFPIEISKENHYFQMNFDSISEVISKIKYFLKVGGGLLYNQQYGINLYNYLFEPFDQKTFNDIENEIKNKLNTYFPYITVISIIPMINNGNQIIDFQINLSINNQQINFTINQ